MVLRALDVDITPLLTGAGIIGLAVGFGAQTLVKDVISGFFMILEDQVRVGDVAIVNGTGGAVEQINLRTIVLRDMEGTVHVIPNGQITTLANRSKDFCVLRDRPRHRLRRRRGSRPSRSCRQTAAELSRTPRSCPTSSSRSRSSAWTTSAASSVSLQLPHQDRPLSQWLVGRELRRRVKKAFDRAGIRLPVQQVEVTMRKITSP